MEIFKDIIGYEGRYQISNLGNVKSLSRKTRFGNNYKISKEKILKIFMHKKGYAYVYLLINSKKKNLLVHRMVALHFIINPENKPQVNHINGIKTDNRVENLEWNTSKENLKHAVLLGLNKKDGINNYKSKLSLTDVLSIRKNEKKLNQRQLSLYYGINQTSISNIINFKTYKNE